MAKRDPFCHLHVHTEFSMLDGLGKIDEYVDRTVELGQRALAITDHGILSGLPEFYAKCREEEIEPILGCEFYYVENYEQVREDKDRNRHHIVMLGIGEAGYNTLCELSTESYRQFYHKPLIDRPLLESLDGEEENLIVLSGCAGSSLSQAILAKDELKAIEELTWWRETFPNYFIELQHHDTDFDRPLTRGLLKLAKRYGVEWVITNDPHYVFPEDEPHHDVLLAVQTASDIDDPDRFSFDGTGYHLRSGPEMASAFSEYGPAVWKRGIRNSGLIAKKARARVKAWEARTWYIPNFPDVEDSSKELKRLTIRGLKERGLHKKREYVKQVKHELKVVEEVGLADFLLITRDFIEWAREQNIPVGPGRGSVAGTLVGYLIGLHKVDPIRYKLMFERFLNPARPRMPDIDTDFGRRRRKELFGYVEDKYGRENVIHVAAFQRMKNRKTFQSVARAYGINYQERIKISKSFPDDEDAEMNDVLPEELIEGYPEMAEQIERLSGLKSSISTHPAGVIIGAPEHKIRQMVPELWIPSSKKWVGQYDLEAAEEMGLLKEDFLGLRNLDVIQQCVALIEEHSGEVVDVDSWIPDEEPRDDEIYKMLSEGRTYGVFQMEGPTNQRGCQDVKPKSFEDVVSVTSLYRTGAISAGFPKQFIHNRKVGRKNIEYIHPALKPILDRTWGVVLYQEQVMEMGEKLAGFSMEQVDDIKEAIKHKKSKLMDSMKPLFIEGCMEVHDMSETVAKQIWKMIEGYSGYGYNRSHAVAYTLLTYQTARLKLLYPMEFITALLREVSDEEKRQSYLVEALNEGFEILPPDINVSGRGATPDYDRNAIRFGLEDVKGVGEKTATKILEGRPEGGYSDYEEVSEAVNNKGVMEALANASVLESLGIPGDEALTEELLKWTFNDKMEEYRAKLDRHVRLPEYDGQEVVLAGEIFKKTKGRTKGGKPYMTWKIRWSLTEQFDVRLWSETQRVWDIPEGSIVMVTGSWEEKWMNVGIGDPNRVRLIKRA